jgi:hypothetical protein
VRRATKVNPSTTTRAETRWPGDSDLMMRAERREKKDKVSECLHQDIQMYQLKSKLTIGGECQGRIIIIIIIIINEDLECIFLYFNSVGRSDMCGICMR